MRSWKGLIAGVLLGVAGCTDPDSESPGDDDTAEQVVLSSATLGPDGGTLTLANGIQLVFPPGALESEAPPSLPGLPPTPCLKLAGTGSLGARNPF